MVMKRILITSIIGFLLYGCGAQRTDYYMKTVPAPTKQKLTVAVIPENWDTYWVSSFAYRALITELMDVGYTVIERSNLVSILAEQKLQSSGLVKDEKSEGNYETRVLDRTSIAKLGEMLGVESLVMIYVVPSGRQLNMATIRVVDVETGTILSSTSIVTPMIGEDTVQIMKQVAEDIQSVLASNRKIERDDWSPNSSPTGYNNPARLKLNRN
jgi:hypothetical protein